MIEISAIVLSPKEADDTLKFVKKQQAEIERLKEANAYLMRDKTVLSGTNLRLAWEQEDIKKKYRVLYDCANKVLADVDAVNKWSVDRRAILTEDGVHWMSVQWLSDELNKQHHGDAK